MINNRNIRDNFDCVSCCIPTLSLLVLIGITIIPLIISSVMVADIVSFNGYIQASCSECTNYQFKNTGLYHQGSMDCEYSVSSKINGTATLYHPYLNPYIDKHSQNDILSWSASYVSATDFICYIKDTNPTTFGYNLKLRYWDWYLFLVFSILWFIGFPGILFIKYKMDG